jgi:NIMA (never in mitosis gene a)-related kinase
MEYADSCDMYQRIQQFKQKGHFMSEKFIWKVLVQIISGLKALHDMHILHRDLKSANVFLYRSGLTKLGDMNVSKVAKAGMKYTQTGTPYYASPEVWQDEPYDFNSDMWSLGCVVYEIAALQPPFQAPSMAGLYKKVVEPKFSRLPRVYSHDLNVLVTMLLQKNPRDRPDCAQVLSLPFLAERTGRSVMKSAAAEVNLLGTIYMPKDLFQLPERLPEPKYASLTERGLNVRTVREVNSKSVGRNRRNLTPSLQAVTRDYSESPGTTKRKILRDNYGAFKLPPMKYPSTKPSSTKRLKTPCNQIPYRIDELVQRIKAVRNSMLHKEESQMW